MPEQKPRIWSRLLLGVSLALNLLVAGVIAGGVLSRNHGPEGRPHLRDSGMFALVVMLPKENRLELRRQLGAGEGASNGGRSVRSLLDARIVELVRGEPFQAVLFEGVLSERRSQQNRRAENAERALTAQVTSMTAEQRNKYADRLERWSRNRDRHGKDKHDRR